MMRKAAARTAITERQNPRSRNLDQKSTREILRLINREDTTITRAVQREIPRIARAADEIAS
ncbi:MAG: N-acetylmuramic acid 6-phosphate etherase, partial [Candidatus Acidiferrales bacterium]